MITSTTMLNSIPSSNGSAHSHDGLSATPESDTHQQLALATTLLSQSKSVALDGYALTLGDVVAVARHNKDVSIDANPLIKDRVDESVAFLKSKVCRIVSSRIS